ncbi:MAG: GTP-binding protein [Clostridia bacterium]|nr:GTP-binding protein [Clostridia bacterium]
MTKIDIYSGFLGAGKTTLIKKMIAEAYSGENIVLIENEFGEIGIDGGFLQDAGIKINEMNSGCICCSLVGDFQKALAKVLADYSPDRIVIEPSGVGKLSDVIRAVKNAAPAGAVLNSFTTVVDVNKCKMYMKNFGEFFNDQIENAGCIILSHTAGCPDAKLQAAVAMLREHNATAVIVTTDWDKLSGAAVLEATERRDTLEAELARLEAAKEEEHHHHHHHHDDDVDDDECGCGDPECSCGHHHHHHHADEIFTSWGVETAAKFTAEQIGKILEKFDDDESLGTVLRAKGIVEGEDGNWIHFDYVPGEADVRGGSAGITGRLCVIGSKLNEKEIAALFGVD